MLSPIQCRIARAALGIGIRELGEIADVSPNTIARLERGETLHPRTHTHLRAALEAEGVMFIDDKAASLLGGPGVRLGGNVKLSALAKLFNDMWGTTDVRAKPEKTYLACLDLLDRYLQIIQQEGREPDLWEAVHLNQMLNDLNVGQVYLAQAAFRNAITPPDNQSLQYPISAEDEAIVEGCDLTYFWKCVAQLRTRGFPQQAAN